MSIILAIETSTDACSVALTLGQNIISELAIEPQAHAKLVLGMVDTVLAQAGLQLSAIDALAFGQGPGSFTGLRIAASVTQGLAFGSNKPVIAISTLQALAQQALNSRNLQQTDTLIVPILDARMQEVYWGIYASDQNGFATAQQADWLQKPAALHFAATKKYLAIGTGCRVYAEILTAQNKHLEIATEILYPHAAEVALLAQQQFLSGNILRAEHAVPVYIRNDVAQTGKKNPD